MALKPLYKNGKPVVLNGQVLKVEAPDDSVKSPGDITFYDYDGTVVESWTLAELAVKSALPEYPSHAGLVCQGWNWTLEDLKTTNRKMNVGAMYITDDGTTRIYIHLTEGRTSPLLILGVNGTVTVDWGDGSEPDVLTGTSVNVAVATPNHEYANPGFYKITLNIDGRASFYASGHTTNDYCLLSNSKQSDPLNNIYKMSVIRIEPGNNIVCNEMGNSFACMGSLKTITTPNHFSLYKYTLFSCRSLVAFVFPQYDGFMGDYALSESYSLRVICTSKTTTTLRTYAMSSLPSLADLTLPDNVSTAYAHALRSAGRLSFIEVPARLSRIYSNLFNGCTGMKYYDFSRHTTVPTLSDIYVFTGIPSDCEIRVPAALVDEWKAATNWATYADHIVGV